MFKQLVATLATLSLLATSPAMAAPEGWDSEHQALLNALEKSGVWVSINEPQVCDATKIETSTHGVYYYDSKYGSLMAVCQDFGGHGDEVLWTENDLDTLRHESVHYLQDCMDGKVDGAMVPLYDGPGGPSPIDYDIRDVISLIGYDNASAIAATYEAAGASEAIIILELEAFLSASQIPADLIADSITAQCPVK